MADDASLHHRICEAILARRLITYLLFDGGNAARLYGSGAREVEPHAYGLTHEGNPAMGNKQMREIYAQV